MNSALVLIAMSVVGVDYGWEITANGEQEYIIQLEPELLNRLRDGEVVTSAILPEVKGVRQFRIQVGTGVLPKGKSTINVGNIGAEANHRTNGGSVQSESEPAAETEFNVEDAAHKGTPSETTQSDANDDAFELDVDSLVPDDSNNLEDAFQLPNDSSDTSLINPDETIATHFASNPPVTFTKIYDGGRSIPVPETAAGLLEHTVTIATTLSKKRSGENEFEDSFPNPPADIELSEYKDELSLPENLIDLAEVNPGEMVTDEGLDEIESIEDAVIPLEDHSDVNSLASNDVAIDFQMSAASSKVSPRGNNNEATVVGAPPVKVEDVPRPWGTLIILCLCLFGSVGANIYMAYMLTGMIRKRKLLPE
tara:strand:+ start:2652 stop:3749 length:1098 start_codon:yes stop_codon:yes gene_type:complete